MSDNGKVDITETMVTCNSRNHKSELASYLDRHLYPGRTLEFLAKERFFNFCIDVFKIHIYFFTKSFYVILGIIKERKK